ncbi:MAG TPA: hypothetical protein VKY85_02475 [Candidatus Angelobacter sp.]|nr:hypothetical protein [Candidatus Angelobacter sp.]
MPHSAGRYFWWSSLRLDSDPLGRHLQRLSNPTAPGSDAEECLRWDPVYRYVDPGWLTRVLMLSALPAFLLAGVIVYILSRLGISQVLSFMISTPVLMATWYYFLGWLLDRRRHKPIAPAPL